MEELIGKLNSDKNYFEKELIEMQMKHDDLIQELKLRDEELYTVRKSAEERGEMDEGQALRIIDLESGGPFCYSGFLYYRGMLV